ncbi:DUF4190 domain-containing protein [Streptomyces johnsoniae]|uniref:Septum formation family protein n=1 Tax=Streptomyces johnsoniae TaxID=3075532 RepID=A0ABU2SE85_9ACTN|nr:septum formation family protein [Streptomyces sp. DSM 41886]MDT0447279.1 septum formation family protein [Streptomyces sp. DSM 41886]
MTTPQPPHGGALPPVPRLAPVPPAPAPPPELRYSGLAVGSLIAAVVFFPAGLVLGILALAGLDRRTERGKGLAVAAVAIASTAILTLAVVIPAVATREDHDAGRGGDASAHAQPGDIRAPGGEQEDGRQEDGQGREGTDLSVFDIAVGDCFDSGSGLGTFDEGAEELTVTRLPCEGPHEAEAFAAVQVEGHDAFPGDDELFALAYRECGARVQGYVLDSWALPLDVQLYYYYPGAATWRLGDREIICFFGQSGGGALTGTLRGDAAAMDADQLRYLEVTTPLEVAIWGEPLPEEGLDARREWAGRMADSVGQEAGELTAESWPREIEPLVAELAEARLTSLAHWNDAAGAGDEGAFVRHVEAGYDAMGIDSEIEIRGILGLPVGG